jgi:hypothetical protein
MHLFTTAWNALPCHRTEGLTASVFLHLIAFVLAATLPATPTSPALTLTYVTEDVLSDPSSYDVDASAAPEEPFVESGFEDTAQPVPPLEIAGFEFDIEKIRRRRNAIFPFLTASFSFLDDVREKFRATPDTLTNPFGRERPSSSMLSLTLSDHEQQRIVDRAWSRRERWRNFSEIATLLTRHDPDNGDAAPLVRLYLDQNLLQPYFDAATRDPRFWAMLGLAADHTTIVDFITGFVRQYPSSRTTTELLFMLDEFAQASRDALLMLLSTDPEGALAQTRAADREAFAFAESLHRQYSRWLREEGLNRTESVHARFDDLRVRILTTIVESTPEGYGASDARFLLGRIFWNANDVQEALRWWRGMTPDGRDSYGIAASAVADEIASADGVSVARISSLLGAEYRRWLALSAARLERFGYAFDTF